MSEREEHPQLSASANRGPVRAAAALQAYFGRLQAHGFINGDVNARAAAAMLIGTIFSDAAAHLSGSDKVRHQNRREH